MANGGKRPGAGRKAKSEEIQLIERLSPMADSAFAALKAGVTKKDFQYVKMFFEYYAGKPKEKMDITSLGEKLESIQVEIIRGTLDKGTD